MMRKEIFLIKFHGQNIKRSRLHHETWCSMRISMSPYISNRNCECALWWRAKKDEENV